VVIEIKLVSDRTGNGLKVQPAAEPTSTHVEDINRSVERRNLWLPDGSEVFEDRYGDWAVRVPGRGAYTLTDAYYVFGKYGAHN
jgi:hypothetical protein